MKYGNTKMSKNGQIVIPAEIRKAMKLRPQENIMVVANSHTMVMKKISTFMMEEEKKLMEDLRKSEEDFEKGRYGVLDMSLSDEELVDQLKGKKHGSKAQRAVREAVQKDKRQKAPSKDSKNHKKSQGKAR